MNSIKEAYNVKRKANIRVKMSLSLAVCLIFQLLQKDKVIKGHL